MAIHKIILEHISYNNNQVLYKQTPIENTEVTVLDGDELEFTAIGAEWTVCLAITDGDYNHTQIIVKPGSPENIVVITKPEEGSLFEAFCLKCQYQYESQDSEVPDPPIPAAPKRIVVVRAGWTLNKFQDSLSNRMKSLALIKDYIFNFKKLWKIFYQ